MEHFSRFGFVPSLVRFLVYRGMAANPQRTGLPHGSFFAGGGCRFAQKGNGWSDSFLPSHLLASALGQIDARILRGPETGDLASGRCRQSGICRMGTLCVGGHGLDKVPQKRSSKRMDLGFGGCFRSSLVSQSGSWRSCVALTQRFLPSSGSRVPVSFPVWFDGFLFYLSFCVLGFCEMDAFVGWEATRRIGACSDDVGRIRALPSDSRQPFGCSESAAGL